MAEIGSGFANAAAPLHPAASVLCLFAFTVAAFDRTLPATEFESRLLQLRVGAISALAGLVPVTDYCGPAGDQNLGDIAWLAPRIRRHAALVEWAMQDGTAFPAPFATLYRSAESLTQFMRAHEAAIGRFLAEMAGKREWELRAFARLDAPATFDRMAALEYPDWPGLTQGRRYMRLSRDKPMLIAQARAAANLLVEDLAAGLQKLTAGMRRHATGLRKDDASGDLIASYACLVPAQDDGAFQAGIAQVLRIAQDRDITLTLSGPWPPYSFRPDLPAPGLHPAAA